MRTSIAGIVVVFVSSLALTACGSSSPTRHTNATYNPAVVHSWAPVKVSTNTSDHEALKGITVVGTSAFAVGTAYSGSADRTLVISRGTSGWTLQSSPNASALHNELDAVAADDPSDVWAVGRYQPSNGQERTLIEHYDGSTWTIVPSPNVGSFHNELDGVVARTMSDVWAVGHYDTSSSGGNHALIEHFDGTKWSVASTPVIDASQSELSGISAFGTLGTMWAVGSKLVGNRTESLTLRQDLGVWRVVASPNRGFFDNSLLAVAAVSTNVAWAVGNDTHNGSSFAVTMRWDGQDWDFVEVPKRLGSHYSLTGVAADRHHRVFAVGNYYAGHADQSVVLQFNGKSWEIAPIARVGQLHNELDAVAASASGSIAAGLYFDGSRDRSLIVRCKC